MRLLFCWYVSTVAKRRQLLAWDASPREKSRSVRSREATAVVILVITVNVNVFATLYVDNCRRFATFASGVDCHLGLASQASNCHRFATEIKKSVREEDQKQFERNLSKNLKLLFVAQPSSACGSTAVWPLDSGLFAANKQSLRRQNIPRQRLGLSSCRHGVQQMVSIFH